MTESGLSSRPGSLRLRNSLAPPPTPLRSLLSFYFPGSVPCSACPLSTFSRLLSSSPQEERETIGPASPAASVRGQERQQVLFLVFSPIPPRPPGPCSLGRRTGQDWPGEAAPRPSPQPFCQPPPCPGLGSLLLSQASAQGHCLREAFPDRSCRNGSVALDMVASCVSRVLDPCYSAPY